MKTEFMAAIKQISAEKNLPKEKVLEVLETALVSAYKKNVFSPNQNISVKINPNTGEVKVYIRKKVVETITDQRFEIALADARKIKAEAQLGDTVEIEATPPNAGRIAAQTAKQVLLQRLHEAENKAIYEEFIGKEGDIVTGVVQRVDSKQIYIDLGKAEAILPLNEQVPIERYRVGQRLKLYLLEVARTPKGPQIIVSRAHRNLLHRLLELEIPEISEGIVEIKAVAREAGHRSKVAVAARQEGIDPVGSCVGLRGIRIQSVVNELSGEKIDIVPWHSDPAIFIANALSPAQVVSVNFDDTQGAATVIVPDRQFSLAIGKEGQNARLAAKLTGWRIDIKSVSMAEVEKAIRAKTVEVTPPTPKRKELIPEIKVTEPIKEIITEVTPVVRGEELIPEIKVTEPVKEIIEMPPVIKDEKFVPEILAELPGEEVTIRFAEEILVDRKKRKEALSRKGLIKSEKTTKLKKKLKYVEEEEFEEYY